MSDILHEDVKEIKAHVIRLSEQGAVHNHLLQEHKSRSERLEQLVELTKVEMHARFAPLDKDLHFRSRLRSVLLAVLGALGTVVGIVAGIRELL